MARFSPKTIQKSRHSQIQKRAFNFKNSQTIKTRIYQKADNRDSLAAGTRRNSVAFPAGLELQPADPSPATAGHSGW